ncbi:hypothetical protein GB937_005500 [Aspergillus fischeri]|nr:hypothetical protein GB937_005500 [Aspergillus fischeri]
MVTTRSTPIPGQSRAQRTTNNGNAMTDQDTSTIREAPEPSDISERQSPLLSREDYEAMQRRIAELEQIKHNNDMLQKLSETVERMQRALDAQNKSTTSPTRTTPDETTTRSAPPRTPAEDDDLEPLTRNDDSSDADTKSVPKVPFTAGFQFKNMHDYTKFVNSMTVHFEQHHRYYAKEHRKVQAAVPLLADKTLGQWIRHRESLPAKQTWEQLTQFLLKQVNDPKTLARRALQKYTDARQLEAQTVADFAAYLEQWESQLSISYTDEQRKAQLWTKLRPNIQSEILTRQIAEDISYTGYVDEATAIERELTERNERKGYTPRRADTSARGGYQGRGRGLGPRKRSFYDRKEQNPREGRSTFKCYNCGGEGHIAAKCPKRVKHDAEPKN